jgi:hypothetical protein
MQKVSGKVARVFRIRKIPLYPIVVGLGIAVEAAGCGTPRLGGSAPPPVFEPADAASSASVAPSSSGDRAPSP